jgi:methionyl-tRNA formyltransferase
MTYEKKLVIITEEAYDEYDVKQHDFENLAQEIGAACFVNKDVMRDEIRNLLIEGKVRVAISVNWKYTLPQDFLDLFECGILNFHLGNLPDYKGNATPNWSILNGEDHIFGNIHRMERELDVGDVLSRKSIPITTQTYVGDILKQAEKDVPMLYEEALEKTITQRDFYVVKGSLQGLRCYPRLAEDSQINWQESLETIHRLIRASAKPFGGAFSYLNGKKVIIWRADQIIPEEKYLAMPGHIIGLDKESKKIRVASRDGFLEVSEIEVDGKIMPP